ncbi:MAG: hypothetical protein Q8J74_14635 [Candidatus Didemnitutus sp.]|nr:hypothetical protein [Candidatus Didemnitutus sp.]
MGPLATHTISLPSAADFGLLELKSASGLCVQLLPSGALFALRHRETLLNQMLPGPAEDGLFRLLVRWKDSSGAPRGWAPLAGPAAGFVHDGCTVWRTAPLPGLVCVTTLAVHPQFAAWAWRVEFRNTSATALTLDVLHAQDLGLADAAAVRNNEAYVSQYLDLLPVPDAVLGHAILARQNQSMAGGRHPWAAFACVEGAAGFCTDGWQFFGTDHRLSGEPAAVREPALPSRRLQYEFALAGLQSGAVALAPGATAQVNFIARFVEDHPAASAAADLALLRELLPLDWIPPATARTGAVASNGSLFTSAPWLAATAPTEEELTEWFPGECRHVERDGAHRTLSFFHGRHTHVVTRGKEALVARPQGHVLRSGDSGWIDDHQFGLTCYAAGIFAAQAYLGNSSLARLLSVVRNPLNVARASGQRVFVRCGASWHQLGVPSVFAMDPGSVRWLYRWDFAGQPCTVEARVWCSAASSCSFLQLLVLAGPPQEFLITHQLALGANEFDAPGRLVVQMDQGWMAALLGAENVTAQHLPGLGFAIAIDDPAHAAGMGGADLLSDGATGHAGPYAVIRTRPVSQCGVIMLGTNEGEGDLAAGVIATRAEFARGGPAASPPQAPVRLTGGADAGAARLNEVLPWFTHNASIHFSAPHGLEQYGGAAWGVRDVCQGSVEWLLAAGEFATVRRILSTLFAQQYADGESGSIAGGWPQWFMFEPFRQFQQAHSHGDVCFWPVKALCDYVEASNDFTFLSEEIGYTDSELFKPCDPAETIWAHCDRVVALCEKRFLSGTALVNYGDGDWDDTLQPADPVMRTRMVSAWTVGLAFHAFRQLADISRRAGEEARSGRLDAMLARMRADFATHLMPGGVVAGFLVSEADGTARPLLHPEDSVTGIRYRLLPMTRAVLAELFTPSEAARHLEIVERELKFTDGVRLMSEPAVYQGGLEKLFKRADTAANVGREVGLQYVHAHLRYAETMAKTGDAGKLWEALQVVNPVALAEVVPLAAPRQSNVYFSSSDADFADRVEAAARWSELRAGTVTVRGGWRLYSSGPGMFLRIVRACLLGVRESFGDVVFDPVLPRSLDGLTADTHLLGRPVRIVYSVRSGTFSSVGVRVNGTLLAGALREPNPYRAGGLRVAGSVLAVLLQPDNNRIEIEL